MIMLLMKHGFSQYRKNRVDIMKPKIYNKMEVVLNKGKNQRYICI